MEEVNQRWAAKSHTLLSRIANLEQQLQGQGQGQSGTSPTHGSQVRHHPLHHFFVQYCFRLHDYTVQGLGVELTGCSV